jgi:signal transduction histidine kinase
VIVPAADLPAFVARVVKDRSGGLSADSRFQLIPPGNRPFYCLSKISVHPNPAQQYPPGDDFCGNKTTAGALLATRDSGQSMYTPIDKGTTTLLGLETPIYFGGVTPASVTARRAAFEGWLGMSIAPSVSLDAALQGHPNIAVTFRYRTASTDVAFSSGHAPRGATSITTDLHNGWTVQTFGAVVGSGIASDTAARSLAITGTASSILLGLLVLVLATGRARALQLVDERTTELQGAQSQLLDAARRAGMAEIATNVLHNVGNVLNSVNVSANLAVDQVRRSRGVGLSRAVGLLHEHAGDLGEYLTNDERGKALPGYLDHLAVALAAERDTLESELQHLTDGVAHITRIVNSQHSLAGAGGVTEEVAIGDLMEHALRMAGVADRAGLAVSQDVADTGPVALDRHRVLLILVNLFTNAVRATAANGERPRRLDLVAEVTAGVLRVTVTDNGEGIAAEDLTRIFSHGFTTRADGHGFGLHSSALAAKEMGGALTVHSDGPGTGACFILQVPLERSKVSA